MMPFTAGGACGQNEARRMVTEKIAAVVEAQTTAICNIITGHKDTVVAGKVIPVLRKRVGTNKRRLSRK
jgi:hypothetical protein